MSVFLEIAANGLDSGVLAGGLNPTSGLSLLGSQGLSGMVLGTFMIFIFAIIGAYIYFSIAFSSIGRKANLQNPSVAWLSPMVTLFEVSKSHWWPMPVMIIGIMLSYIVLLLSPIIGVIFLFAFYVFAGIVVLYWHWKTFEAISRPGWWIIIPVVLLVLAMVLPLIDISLSIFTVIFSIITGIIYAILVGIAAWGNPEGK